MFFKTKKLNRKVLGVAITKDVMEPLCIESLNAQTYKDFKWMLHVEKPLFISDDPVTKAFNYFKNCSHNRNEARKIALASDADWFLFIDSDIQLPINAVEELMLQAKQETTHSLWEGKKLPIPPRHIIAGWYKMENSDLWNAANWVADNVIAHFRNPEASLIPAGMIGLGCCLISREVLQKIEFEAGTDKIAKMPDGRDVYLEECAAFSNRAYELGYDLWMNGSVICGHIKKGVIIK